MLKPRPRPLGAGRSLLVRCHCLHARPAIWNRFPLLQYDTGGYLARWFEGYLVPAARPSTACSSSRLGRSRFLAGGRAAERADGLGAGADAARAGFGGRPWLLLGVIAALSVCTTLPWLTSILLTDIFAASACSALYLLMLRADALRRAERIG